MIITQEIKSLCRNDAQLQFRDLNNQVRILLTTARSTGAVQYLYFGMWQEAYAKDATMIEDVVYRIDPEWPTTITEKSAMKITAEELALCQNTDRRCFVDLPMNVSKLIGSAAKHGIVQLLGSDLMWRTLPTKRETLHLGFVYRIDPMTPVAGDNKPEFVEYPVSLDAYGRYFATIAGMTVLVADTPAFKNFYGFTYTQKDGQRVYSAYLSGFFAKDTVLTAVRFRNP